MKISGRLKWIILIELLVPTVLLILGIYHGLVQTLYRAGLIKETSFFHLEYYQGLTLHGVINAIVLTTFFAVSFGHVIMTWHMKRQVNEKWAGVSMLLMIVGTLMAAYPMLTGTASVLYTFYPPLMAHPLFYLGAAILVVGSWVAFFGWIIDYRAWKKDNPETKMPLAILGNIVNFSVWFVCSLAVAFEILVLLLPWSLGWTETVHIPLARTLFWFFGHALVYFWLLPSYICFYTILPKVAGGKLYSENAGKFALLLFLILSIPVGVHHQFGDPSITQGVKFFHSFLTFGVAIPSFITAFTIAASLEYAGRLRGAKGLFGWMERLPWFNSEKYLFAYFICGLILFIFGGLTGLVNASYNLNNVVHNTAWIPGHFHMTVAGPVFLTILGMTLYLYNKLSGRPLQYKRFATMVPYLWTIGVLVFSTGLMWGGLIGEPRRTNMGMSYLNPDSQLFRPDWIPTTELAVFGGITMTLACLFFFIAFFKMVFAKQTEESKVELPDTENLHDEAPLPLLQNLKPWYAIMIVVIFLAYVPAIKNALDYTKEGAPAYLPDNPLPVSPKDKAE
jgi:cytochrome c oxidase subunit I